MAKKIARLTVSPQQFNRLVDNERQVLEQLGLRYQVHHHRNEQEPDPQVLDAQIVLVNSRYQLDTARIDKFTQLEFILIPNSGFDHVDWQYAQDKGIDCSCIPEPRCIDVSETTLMAMLESVRKSPETYDRMRQGAWHRNEIEGTSRLLDQIIGIIGVGHIGSRVCQLLRPFEPRAVLACDPFVDPDRIRALGARPVELDELLAHAQIISLHCSLNPGTRNMVDREFLERMHPGATLINTARGKLIDEDALKAALENGTPGAYFGDVFANEPLAADHWLRAHPRAFLSPHVSGYSFPMLSQLIAEEVRYVRRWMQGETFRIQGVPER